MENVRKNILSLLIDTIVLFNESSSLTDQDHLKSLLILPQLRAHVLRIFHII
jgi:hypothetical protein